MLAERTGRFRHVVFADPLNGGRCYWRGGKILNFAPPPPSDMPRAEPVACQIDPAAKSFVRRLFALAQLDVNSYRCETLARRIPACLRALRARSLDHAYSIVMRDPRLIPAAMEQLLIGVTSFFRDEAVFGAIRTIVIPALASRRKPVRVWSTGCSNGAELYSIAMLLAEHGLIAESLLLGTDCRPEAISAAKRATYDSTCLAQVPPHLARRLLVRWGDQLRVHGDLVRQARWRCADLLSSLEPGGWDIILCRNLAMYLAPESAARLWEALDSLLLPGGWLIAGRAERPAPARRLRSVASCVFQRQS